MKHLRLIFLTASLLLTASCAHLQSPLPAAAKPDGKTAVLYGRFSVGRNFAFHNKLALWLVNDGTRDSIYLYFDPDQPVYGIRVKPGNYHVQGFAALNRMQKVEGRKIIPQVPRPFTVAAGSETYLGDYLGETKWDGVMVATWRIKSWTNNFAATTAEFRQQCPQLAMTPAASIFAGPKPIP